MLQVLWIFSRLTPFAGSLWAQSETKDAAGRNNRAVVDTEETIHPSSSFLSSGILGHEDISIEKTRLIDYQQSGNSYFKCNVGVMEAVSNVPFLCLDVSPFQKVKLSLPGFAEKNYYVIEVLIY